MSQRKEVNIIGAGITGLASALVLAEAGHRVRLLDSQEPARSTSDNTLRVIHGGLRYLQDLNLVRSLRSIRSQQEFKTRFPEYIKALPCVMPLSRSGIKSRIPVSCAINFYNLFFRVVSGTNHPGRVITSGEAIKRVGLLANYPELPGALYWEDLLLTSHHKLVSSLLNQLVDLGVKSDFNFKVVRVDFTKGQWSVLAADGNGEVKSDLVIECTGPSLGRTITNSPGPRVDLVKAFNFRLGRCLEADCGLGFSGAGRLFFLVPRGEGSAIGTWYSDSLIDEAGPLFVSEQEKGQAVDEIKQAFPSLGITLDDIVGEDVGLLPAVKRGGKIVVLGSERISCSGSYLSVLSTKYTTAFEVARELKRKIARL